MESGPGSAARDSAGAGSSVYEQDDREDDLEEFEDLEGEEEEEFEDLEEEEEEEFEDMEEEEEEE